MREYGKPTATSATVEVEYSLYGGLPLLDTHRGEVMGVQSLHLLYRSSNACPWLATWTAQGYDNETGHALLDVASQRIPRADWPGWIVDLVAKNLPRTGDRVSLPGS